MQDAGLLLQDRIRILLSEKPLELDDATRERYLAFLMDPANEHVLTKVLLINN